MPSLRPAVAGILASMAILLASQSSKAVQATPGSGSDPAELSVWPNQTSRANGDAWLVENHHRIRRMSPRLLLINFSNEHPTNHLWKLAQQIIDNLAEGSRYHGYRDSNAPAFLNYEIFKFVDLRDSDRSKGNSRQIPVKDPEATNGFNMKYETYFTDEFAKLLGVADPMNTNRCLRLDELVNGGYVHEVWFFESGNVKATPHVGSYEVVELKPVYDDKFQRVPGRHVQAGNGGDREQPWTGRSVRIGCINASRGPGCFLESLSHGFEGMANSKAIPYLHNYFREFAGFDLKERYNVPFGSLYAARQVDYPDAHTLTTSYRGTPHTISNYVAAAGNVHFAPNGRRDYDMANTNAVMSTIEDWRIGSGVDGNDKQVAWNNDRFKQYRKFSPDCMGPWLIYWRQNFPGLDNRQKDDERKPMKNWWPFLFY